jgi:hypothetical protein
MAAALNLELLVSDGSCRQRLLLKVFQQHVALMMFARAGCAGPHILQLLRCSSGSSRRRAQAEEGKNCCSSGSGGSARSRYARRYRAPVVSIKLVAVLSTITVLA